MPNESLSGRRMTAVAAVLILGNSVLVNAAGPSGRDGWMALLLALAGALPLVLLYGRLIRLSPEADLFGLLFSHFGRILGGTCAALMALYFLFLGAAVIQSFTSFLTLTALPETPAIPIGLFLMTAVFYLARKGVALLGRWAVIVLAVIAAFLLIVFLFAFKSMDYRHLLPVGTHTPGTVGLSALSFLTFPFGELVLLLALVGGAGAERQPGRRLLRGLLIGGGLLLLLFFFQLFVLGDRVISSAYFPTYNAARILSAGHFWERMEALVAVGFLLTGLTKVAVCLMAAARGLGKLFLIPDDRALLLPTGLVMLALSSILFGSMSEMSAFLETCRLYALVLQAVLPLALWMAAEMKSRRKAAVSRRREEKAVSE